MVMLLFHIGIYGNCCRLNILVITNRHCIVTNWFYQVITIHSDTTQICSKQLIFSGSVNNSSPASDYITWSQYISASFIHILVPYITKQKMSPRQLCLVICPICQLNRGFRWQACFGEVWASRPHRLRCAPTSWLAHWPCCQCCGSPSSCIW